MQYRADIDGLRAVAVISVVLFHAIPNAMPGGFVGVDVFFVISGYLISALIMEQNGRGTFSFVQFYERRLRRLVPAFVVVASATLVAAYLLYAPKEFEALGKSVTATILLHANHFFLDNSGYFSAPAEVTPLLHMWSLSVEEQFYLVFPAALVFILRRSQRPFFWLAFACLISFLASCYMVVSDQETAFFLLPFRVWEFLLGTLMLAPSPPIGRKIAAIMGGVGAALVLASLILLKETSAFPGWNAIAPSLGAALLIKAGATSPTGRALSFGPVNYIGRTSYSFYLWHWPLICFFAYVLDDKLNVGQGLLAVLASLVLAMLTYHAIEIPFRSTARKTGKLALALVGSTALLAAGIILDIQNGLASRLPEPLATELRKEALQIGPPRDSCRLGNMIEADQRLAAMGDAGGVRVCRVGSKDVIPSLVIWGDSHGDALAPAFDEKLKQLHLAAYSLSRGGCPPMLGLERVDSPKWRCRDFNNAVMSTIERLQPDKIVIAANWPYYFRASQLATATASGLRLNDQDIAGALMRTLTWASSKAPVNIMAPVPDMGKDTPSVLAKTALLGKSESVSVSLQNIRERQATSMDAIKTASSDLGIPVLDPVSLLCNETTCIGGDASGIIFADSNHLSAKGAQKLAPLLDQVIDVYSTAPITQ